MSDPDPPYLAPYRRAAAVHGDGFGSLLWASPKTQTVRFDALQRVVECSGRTVLDAGCGRADLLDYFDARGVRPADYLGLEAVDELAAAAGRKERAGVRVRRGDFIAEPVRLFVGAEVVVFSGSLNTAADGPFYQTLRRAFDATAWAVAFNFLCSPDLAGAGHLHWRPRADVEAFVRSLGPRDVRVVDDYLPGDCTIGAFKDDPHG